MANAGGSGGAGSTDYSQYTRQMAMNSGGVMQYNPPYLNNGAVGGTAGYVNQASQYFGGIDAASNNYDEWDALTKGRIQFAEQQTAGAMMASGGIVPGPTEHRTQVGHAIPPPFLASAASRFSGVNGSHQALPGVSGYDQGGVVAPMDPSGVQSAIAANPGAPALPGAAQAGAGTAIPPQAVPASADPQTVVPPPQAQQQQSAPANGTAPPVAVSQPAARGMFQQALEAVGNFFHIRALDDDGVPNYMVGIKSPPPTAAMSNQDGPAAATGSPDPRTVRGTPQNYDVTGKVAPHSLSPTFWEDSDAQIQRAVRFGALAGENPAAVYGSLDAMRTSYIQSHMLRWLSTASVALQNNDQKSAAQALRNANYYLPNGQSLKVETDSKGNLVYQDPIYPYVGKNGQPLTSPAAGASPRMIPVDQQHIKMLGTALLNPMAVQDVIMSSRAAVVKQQQEMLQAQGSYLTGQGRAQWGAAAATRANADAQRVASQNYRDLSAADLDRARAASGAYALRLLQSMRLDPTAAKAAQDAANAVDALALGPPTQVSPTDAQGNPSLSPAAGKVIHDTSRADPALSRASASDIAQVKAWAAGMVAANPRGMTAQQAASFAAEAYRHSKTTHRGPNGNAVNDVMIDRQRGSIHIWSAKARQWINLPMAQGSALPLGSVPPGLFSLAAGGSSAGASPAQLGSDQVFSNPPSWMDSDNASNPAP